MIDPKTVIKAFDRIEQENGGLEKTDPNETLAMTAKSLGLEVNKVRTVMIDHWTMRGGG